MRTLQQKLMILTVALLLPATLTGTAAGAEEGRRRKDHDVARRALEQGEILPLESVLAEVRKTAEGEVADVELEREHGTWIYEIKMIGPAGVLTKIKVDAKTGRILRVKER